jgi:hypothetical protein
MRFAAAVHSAAWAGGARNRTTVVKAFSARQALLRCCGLVGSKSAVSDCSVAIVAPWPRRKARGVDDLLDRLCELFLGSEHGGDEAGVGGVAPCGHRLRAQRRPRTRRRLARPARARSCAIARRDASQRAPNTPNTHERRRAWPPRSLPPGSASTMSAPTATSTAPRAHGQIDLDIESIAAIELPDGKVIYPRKLRGEPIDRVAARCWTCSSRAGRGSCGWSARRARARARAGARSPTGCRPGAVGRSRRAAASRSTASPRCRADRPRTSSTLCCPSRPRGPSRFPRLRVADVGRLEVHGRKQ